MLEYNVSGGVFLVFYVDVYFLINLTVDILAVNFSSRFTKIRTSFTRILIISVIGALLAVVEILLPTGVWLFALFAALMFISVSILISKDASASRRVRCAVFFFLLEALIGGVVSFVYSLFDKYAYKTLSSIVINSPNRKLLFLSLTVILIAGAFKLILLLFSGLPAEKSVSVRLEFLSSTIVLDALVDTGNLLKDPSTLKPVILLKGKEATALAPAFPQRTEDLANISGRLSKHLCIIPVSIGTRTRLLVGFRPKKITVRYTIESKEQQIDAVVAIDTEGGTYGGFYALMPAAALN